MSLLRRRGMLAQKSQQHTVIDCITIPNNATYGYNNGVNLPYPLARVSKAIANLKAAYNNNIILCGFTANNITTSPYWNVEGRVHIGSFSTISTTISASGTNTIHIGSWADSVYSHSNAFKFFELYDSNNVLITRLIPVLKDSKPLFYDEISGEYFDNWNGNGFLEGEVF